MAEFKVVVNDPKKVRSYQITISDESAEKLIGKKIGDKFPGEILNLPGYELEITGGSDKQGFPMHKGVPGTGRVRPLLSKGPGFRPKFKGYRRRKTLRGNTIAEDIAQINCKVVKYGEKALEELMPKKEEKQES